MTEADMFRALLITDKDRASFYKMAAPDFGFVTTDVAQEGEQCPEFFGDGSSKAVPEDKTVIRTVGENSKRVDYWHSVDELALTITTILRLRLA